MSIYLRNALRFIMLILIQVLILNTISLRWWSNPGGIPPYVPFVYPLFILILPLSTPTWFVLVSSFFLGLSIDTFSDTGGMHAAACVLMGFARTSVLSLLLPKRLSEYQNMTPNAQSMGWTPFLTYASILLAIHHVFFFLLEVWSLSSILYLLLKVVLTLVTSIIFTLLYTFLFSKSISTTYYDKWD